ncbi:MAG: DUF2975 domain-containing protein [Alphaproteobacteria bacterium]|nr:DUF2975 domain-containing protein [Alphaproteobacteria bacterium]
MSMQSPDQASRRVARVRRVSRIMMVVSGVLAAAGPILLIPVWLSFEHFAAAMVPGLRIDSLSELDRAGGYLISLLPAGIAAWGFITLSRLFARFASGDTLGAANARLLHRFACAVLFTAPAKWLSGALLSVWLTRDAAPGEHQLILSLSSNDIAFAALGMLLMILSWVMRDAAEIADEHRQFV